jgi:hypothetical protein
MSTLQDQIDDRIGEVRLDTLDLSFGEIVNLHSSKELIIHPDYQRLFRWSDEQKSRLIESILLGLPIPEIFVIENDDGTLELIDGLQRVSSVIQFIQGSAIDLDDLVLVGCDLVEHLNGKRFDDIPLKLRLGLKRATVRTITIKSQSKSILKYEMFKRLNTGGEALSAQEIRNCSARMLGDAGTEFYTFLRKCEADESFRICTEELAESDRSKKGDEELVLRFFACKNAENLFSNNVRNWLDVYMEKVLLSETAFEYEKEKETFRKLFGFLSRVMGKYPFVKYKNGLPTGGLAPAYFEAVSIGVLNCLDHIVDSDAQTVRNAIISVVQSSEFRDVTGPGANTKPKLRGRISLIQNTLTQLPK